MLSITVEKLNEKLGILGFQESLEIANNEIEEISMDNIDEIKDIVGEEKYNTIKEELKKMEDNSNKLTKETYTVEKDYDYKLEELDHVEIPVSEIYKIAKTDIDRVNPDTIDEIKEIIGDEYAEKLIPNTEIEYVKYINQEDEVVKFGKQNMELKLGFVTWDRMSITKTKNTKGVDFAGTIYGASDKKKWKANYFIETDGTVSFPQSDFDITKTKIRLAVQKLRKEVNQLMMDFEEIQLEQTEQNKEEAPSA